jgi:hypothetical protein
MSDITSMVKGHTIFQWFFSAYGHEPKQKTAKKLAIFITERCYGGAGERVVTITQ